MNSIIPAQDREHWQAALKMVIFVFLRIRKTAWLGVGVSTSQKWLRCMHSVGCKCNTARTGN